ncbi:MAG: serine/threonine-protein phosphatase [Pseudomonadales bacterium]|nr:serine/threonine-protein phosphatase [Pseudomonadales bacterium]
MSWQMAEISHEGCFRPRNEDSVSCFCVELKSLKETVAGGSEQAFFAIIADGVGGQRGGHIASRLAVRYFQQYIHDHTAYLHSTESCRQLLIEAAEAANQVVCQARKDDATFAKMGTTLVAVLIIDDQMFSIHAGDSRVYAFDDSKLIQLTRDDSLVEKMLEDGDIEAAHIDNLPYKNVLLKALGSDADISFSINHRFLDEVSVLLLCSDGLYNAVSDQQLIMQLNKKVSAKDKTLALLKQSLDNQARDNVSAIVIQKTLHVTEELNHA